MGSSFATGLPPRAKSIRCIDSRRAIRPAFSTCRSGWCWRDRASLWHGAVASL